MDLHNFVDFFVLGRYGIRKHVNGYGGGKALYVVRPFRAIVCVACFAPGALCG